jgi:hypothetical protein
MDTGASAIDHPDPTIVEFVENSGLVTRGISAGFERLPGGVSSDIWLVHADDRSFCVKRALAQLRVAADWRAPIERQQQRGGLDQGGCGFYAGGRSVSFGRGRRSQHVRDGLSVAAVLRGVEGAAAARRCAAGHRRRSRPALGADSFARSPAAAAEFATDSIFHAILEPYLLATARAHPDRVAAWEKLAETTAHTKLTLVHGNVSPKNILVGPHGPVFIDAECAWFGDPAFDLAFCLNHLLLKCLWVPGAAGRLLAAFQSLTETYLDGVDWEARQDIDSRAVQLLPGLFLARIDGKSPVEYLTEERDKDTVRRVARSLLARPPGCLAEIRQVWASEIHAIS